MKDRFAKNTDLQTALGQCFWIGLNGTTVSDPQTKRIFDAFVPGGIVLFQRNVESLNQIRSLNQDLQKSVSIPLLIAVDQEGGTVERLHELIGHVPPAMALAAASSEKLIRKIHTSHARLLRHLGFNVNFTPVLDLALTHANNGLGTRCFSDDPKMVTRNARAVIDAHRSAGVHVSGKHFPGLGDTQLDSHLSLPTVQRHWKTIKQQDLLPYKRLLDELPFVMVNHALYPDKNSTMPASLAKEIVQEFLVKEWEYGGLAISDDLNMGAVSNMYNLAQAAERALRAGNHVFLICKPDGVVEAYRKLLRAAGRDAKLAETIYRNSNRILTFKITSGLNDPFRCNVRKEIKDLAHFGTLVAGRAVTLLHGRLPKNLPESLTLYFPKTAKYGVKLALPNFGCSIVERAFSPELSMADAQGQASKSNTDWNIVVCLNRGNNPGQNHLLQELLDRGKTVFVVEAGFPEPVPPGVEAAVASYWAAPQGTIAALRSLLKEQKAAGKSPLQKIPSLVS